MFSNSRFFNLITDLIPYYELILNNDDKLSLITKIILFKYNILTTVLYVVIFIILIACVVFIILFLINICSKDIKKAGMYFGLLLVGIIAMVYLFF